LSKDRNDKALSEWNPYICNCTEHDKARTEKKRQRDEKNKRSRERKYGKYGIARKATPVTGGIVKLKERKHKRSGRKKWDTNQREQRKESKPRAE
jgi:hypothetical protein